jgi:hypothetical protein
MRLQLNPTEADNLCLCWLMRVAWTMNNWLNPNMKMVTLMLVISIPFNRNYEQVGDRGYVPTIFIFKPLPVIVTSISAVIVCSAVAHSSFL